MTVDTVAVANFARRVERDSSKNYTNGYYVQVYGYKRVGDAICIPAAENEWYIRSFTPTSFI